MGRLGLLRELCYCAHLRMSRTKRPTILTRLPIFRRPQSSHIPRTEPQLRKTSTTTLNVRYLRLSNACLRIGMEDDILHFPEGAHEDDVVGNLGQDLLEWWYSEKIAKLPPQCLIASRNVELQEKSVARQPVYLPELHHLDDFTFSQRNILQPQHISRLRIPLEWPYLLSTHQRTPCPTEPQASLIAHKAAPATAPSPT